MKKSGYCLFPVLFCLVLLLTSFTRAEIPVNKVDGKFITNWLLLGPLFPDDIDNDFLEKFGGESSIAPGEGDLYITESGDTVTWRLASSHRDIVDLLEFLGDHQGASAYAFCRVKCDSPGAYKMLLGSDDGAAVWINGERVHHNPAARALFLDNDIFEAVLRKGDNNCLVKISQGSGEWGFSLRIVPFDHPVPATPIFYLSSSHIMNRIWLPNTGWRYHPGDNPEWGKPDIDDSAWPFANPELGPGESAVLGWPGAGWFRFHFIVDSSLFNQTLGFWLWQSGASQIYLDGQMIYSIGEHPGDWAAIPKAIKIDHKQRHVLAVRYVQSKISGFHDAGINAGFSIRLGQMNEMTEETVVRERTLISFQMFLTSLSLAIGILHLVLFVFMPGLRQNLYFALFLFSYAATIYFDYQIILAADINEYLLSFRLHCAVLPFWVLFQLRFVYAIFYRHLPWQFWAIFLAALSLGSVMVYNPLAYFSYFSFIYIVVVIEVNRVIVIAWMKKKEGVWIIGMGFLVFYIFGLMDTLMDQGIILIFSEMANPYAFGSISFFIAMTVYLSRDFARANMQISDQKMEQKLLETENARQAKELEEARQLQLSMLPGEIPQHPRFEIAAFMKTATEVGGDYYDFKLHDDGTLTLVIGDATGHGMAAGTMVSATKSLFHSLADEPSLVQFLSRGSSIIKSMGLKKIYMALTIAKFKDNNLRIAAAGMPYPLVWRASISEVEEVVLKGMPLGGHSSFPYQETRVHLEKGDTVLFISDGFEEMFSPEGETFGMEQVRQIFKQVGGKSPDEIIEHLREAGDSWANGRPQEDDVTFMVLKIK